MTFSGVSTRLIGSIGSKLCQYGQLETVIRIEGVAGSYTGLSIRVNAVRFLVTDCSATDLDSRQRASRKSGAQYKPV